MENSDPILQIYGFDSPPRFVSLIAVVSTEVLRGKEATFSLPHLPLNPVGLSTRTRHPNPAGHRPSWANTTHISLSRQLDGAQWCLPRLRPRHRYDDDGSRKPELPQRSGCRAV